MRTAHAKPCQRTANELPTGGFTLSKFGARDRVLIAGGGRPELESYTPVNIGNGPYRDNGEGVAATPLPYPLWSEGARLMGRVGVREFVSHTLEKEPILTQLIMLRDDGTILRQTQTWFFRSALPRPGVAEPKLGQ